MGDLNKKSVNISFKTKFFNLFRLLFKLPLLEKSLARLTLNRPETSFWIKLIPNNYQYPPKSWRQANRRKINYKLDLHDYVDWWIYFGLKEISRKRLYTLINKNDVIIDIGTNMGETLMNFSILTGSNGNVHGFEPDSINYHRCLENLGLNTFTNIMLNRVGLGNKNGQFKLKVDTSSNRGGNRITFDSNENGETIDVITLDGYVTSNALNKINLIKIDVEGFEFNVLKGSEKTLLKFRPILFIELDDLNLRQQGASAQLLVKFLTAMKYKIRNSETDVLITENTDFEKCHFDIVCISSET